MWVFLSNAFVSIVAPKPGSPAEKAGQLVVRARIKGDLQSVFPGCRVEEDKGTDYRFRTLVDRRKVAELLHVETMKIAYGNFKSSVTDHARHMAYMGVWREMSRYQEANRPKRGKGRKTSALPHGEDPLTSLQQTYPDAVRWDHKEQRWTSEPARNVPIGKAQRAVAPKR